MSSKLATESDGATSTKLALIYSRLAELESQKEKKINVWDDVCKRFSASDIDPAEIANIEMIFKDASQNIDDSEAISRIRMLFLAEDQFANTLSASLQDKIKKVQAFQSERDGHASEVFRLREEMMKLHSRNDDLEELCRNLQKLAKEKDTHRQQLLEAEKLKSEQLEAECISSISTVTKKIDREEEELLQKEQENESLREKLEEFKQHLNLRKEKRQNEMRAQELQRRLLEARRAQANYLKEQEQLQRHSTKARIKQMEDTVNSLRQQASAYASKFEEFESTLEKSIEVLAKIDEREKALSQIADRLKEEQQFLKNRAAETDVQVIRAMETRRTLDADLVALKAQYEKMSKKCRKMLARRQELMNATVSAGSGTTTATSTPASSSSTSGEAAAVGTSSSSNASSSSSSSSSARVPGSMPTGRMKTPSPTAEQLNTSKTAFGTD